MDYQIRWGVLGYARIAKSSVIPAILQASNARLYAVASTDERKQSECRELFRCDHVYDTYDRLLDDPAVDAVYVPLPNSLHKQWAIKAMKKGKHVLCEKPMALNAAECREMIETAKAQSVWLMEAFMYRFTDRMAQVRTILNSGELGEIRYIQSTFRFLLNRSGTIKVKPELGGGSLYDVGCYPVNLLGFITQALPLSCQSVSVMQGGVDMQFSAVLHYPNQMLASISCGFDAFRQMNAEIVGTKGRLEIPDTFLGTAGVLTVETESGRRLVEVRQTDRYLKQIEDFSDAVLANRQPLVRLEDTALNMQVLDLLRNSMT